MRPLRTGLLTWSAFAGMFMFGVVMTAVGVLLPRLSIGYAEAGNLFLVMNACMLLSMLCLGPVMDRRGKKLPLAAGSALVAVALALMAGQAGYGMLAGSVALLGIGGGALNGATNTLVSDLHTDPRRKNSALNLLGVFFGFGALFLPLVIGSLLERAGLAPILWATAALSAAIACAYLALEFPPPLRATGAPLADTLRLARNPLVLLFGFLLFFQSGNEFVLSGFTPKYLERSFDPAAASFVYAGFWAAIMLTRVVASRLLLTVKPHLVVLASALAAWASVLVMAAASSRALTTVAVMLTGVSFASIYPTVLGLAGTRFQDRSGTAFGILFSIALAGGMMVPWVFGQIAQTAGPRAALALPAAGALIIFILQLVITRAKS